MDTQQIIEQLRALGLDPILVEPLIGRLEAEGLTDETKKEVVTILTSALAQEQVAEAAYRKTLTVLDESQAEIEAVEEATEDQVLALQQDLEAKLAVNVPGTESVTPPIIPDVQDGPPPAPTPFAPQEVEIAAPPAPQSMPQSTMTPQPAAAGVGAGASGDWTSLLK